MIKAENDWHDGQPQDTVHRSCHISSYYYRSNVGSVGAINLQVVEFDRNRLVCTQICST